MRAFFAGWLVGWGVIAGGLYAAGQVIRRFGGKQEHWAPPPS
jgi:hypothetical protein